MLFQKALVFGDSLSTFARSKTTWWIELSKIFHSQHGVNLIFEPYTFSGFTASQLYLEVLKAKPSDEIKECFVQCGTNDAKDEVATTVEEFGTWLELIKRALFRFRVYFLTIPEPKGFGSHGYTKNIVKRIKEYNEVIRTQGLFVEVNPLSQSCFSDGIHYSDEGCKEVAKKVYEKIKEVRLW